MKMFMHKPRASVSDMVPDETTRRVRPILSPLGIPTGSYQTVTLVYPEFSDMWFYKREKKAFKQARRALCK